MNYKTYLMKILMVWLIIMNSFLLTAELSAYDGDVDYSAPYITVDPETGKLVTIDPKAQQQPQHPAADPNSTQTATPANQSDVNVQDSQVMAQSAMGNATDQSENNQTTMTSPLTPVLIGIVILGVAAAIMISSRRKKATSNTGDKSAVSTESS